MIEFFVLNFPQKGSPEGTKIFNWWFGNGWHCSRATKFSTITCQAQW